MNLRLAAVLLVGLSLTLCRPVLSADDGDPPTLLERLRSEDPEARAWALYNVDEVEGRDPVVFAEITRLLDDPDPKVREPAVSNYLGFGGDLEIGRKFLADPDGSVRSSALASLQGRQPDVKLAESFLADPDADVRKTALRSYLKLGGDPVLVEPLLSDPSELVRRTAFNELHAIRKDLDLARRMMSDDDKYVREYAIVSFLELGGDPEVLVPFFDDPETNVRLSVARTFVKAGLHLDRAVEALLRIVIEGEKDLDVEYIMEALGGERAVEVASRLVEIIGRSPDVKLVSAADASLPDFDGLRTEHADALLVALDREPVEARRAAASALRDLARTSQFAPEWLVWRLNDDDALVRIYCAVTLLQLGREQPAAIDCLRAILQDSPDSIQFAAIDELPYFPDAAANLVPELVDLLGVRESMMRDDVVDALSHVAPDAVVPRLVAEIEAPDALQTHVYLWESIARLLGKYGTAASRAIPNLIFLSRHADPDVIFAATTALGTVGVGHADAIERLHSILVLDGFEQRTRIAALKSLVASAGDDDTLRSDLRIRLHPFLSDSDLLLRVECVRGLLVLGEEPSTVVPALHELLLSDDGNVVFKTLDQLHEFPPLRDASLQVLNRLVESDVWWGNAVGASAVRDSAPQALAAAGPAAVPVLIERLEHPESGIRGNAAAALGSIGSAASPAVPQLIEQLDDKGRYTIAISNHFGWPSSVRHMVVAALGDIGPPAAPAVPALLRILAEDPADDYLNIRGWSVAALGGIGPAAAEAVPTLWSLAESGDEDSLKLGAVCALARITPDDPRVVPALNHLLQWLAETHGEDGLPGSSDADALFEASERLGERARPLIPSLHAMFATVPILQTEVRLRAAECVLRIDRDDALALEFLHRRLAFEERDEYYLGYRSARVTLDKLTADGVINPQ